MGLSVRAFHCSKWIDDGLCPATCVQGSPCRRRGCKGEPAQCLLGCGERGGHQALAREEGRARGERLTATFHLTPSTFLLSRTHHHAIMLLCHIATARILPQHISIHHHPSSTKLHHPLSTKLHHPSSTKLHPRSATTAPPAQRCSTRCGGATPRSPPASPSRTN